MKKISVLVILVLAVTFGMFGQEIVPGSNIFSLNSNVGIGTALPNAKLDVAGLIRAHGIEIIDSAPEGTQKVIDFHGYGSSAGDYFLRLNKVYSLSPLGNRQYSWRFHMHNQNVATVDIMTFNPEGNVGIGTIYTTHRLTVNGGIGAKYIEVVNVAAAEIIVDTDNYADFVFEDDYELPGLDEVEAFIEENGHLPEIPSEAEALENGINIADMNVKLLQKVEELTLYLIDQNKQLQEQAAELAELKEQLAE